MWMHHAFSVCQHAVVCSPHSTSTDWIMFNWIPKTSMTHIMHETCLSMSALFMCMRMHFSVCKDTNGCLFQMRLNISLAISTNES